MPRTKGQVFENLVIDPRTINYITSIMFEDKMVDIETGLQYNHPDKSDIRNIGCESTYILGETILDMSKMPLLEKLKLARKVAILKKELEPDYKKYR